MRSRLLVLLTAVAVLLLLTAQLSPHDDSEEAADANLAAYDALMEAIESLPEVGASDLPARFRSAR